jgi:GDPmannose 4,6-dehydratase
LGIKLKKKAFITGITGQDGSYLAELLLFKGYEVHGLIRRSSSFNTGRLDLIYKDPHDKDNDLHLHYGDLTDSVGLSNLLKSISPDEIYNLGAQSHVKVSFDIPGYTASVDALAVANMLEIIRNNLPKTKFYQAGTSEMFGDSPAPQSIDTEFRPRSPYAAAKIYAHWVTRNYREGQNIYASNGILFNHESPRRGATFVTQKIVQAAVSIKQKRTNKIYLGNIDAYRDWGYAPEYVVAMWEMLQLDSPTDLVVATGVSTTIREFGEYVFKKLDLDFHEHLQHDSRYERPTEVEDLRGDVAQIHKVLGWKPRFTWKSIADVMLEAELSGEKIINWDEILYHSGKVSSILH